MMSGIILDTERLSLREITVAARGRAKRIANREGGLLARLSALRLRNRTKVADKRLRGCKRKA